MPTEHSFIDTYSTLLRVSFLLSIVEFRLSTLSKPISDLIWSDLIWLMIRLNVSFFDLHNHDARWWTIRITSVTTTSISFVNPVVFATLRNNRNTIHVHASYATTAVIKSVCSVTKGARSSLCAIRVVVSAFCRSAMRAIVGARLSCALL